MPRKTKQISVKVSSRYQIVLPKGVREALGLRPGDRLLVALEGSRVVLRPKPQSYAQALRGLHQEVWQGLNAQEYVEKEREGWA
ncbi:AbrB/MazE/SpoVT family DNA-binding domain-containing protein [Candidatus Hadarchaeum sp.]|uniref:AbrB/MazE/SpoVT family DNA-binding domain-containing protein n=1 Tax=Candidatus Hadarchaeum sp. TaxID=2883567 RepID=UPI00319E5ACE